MDKGNFKVLINNKTFELDKLSQCDSNLKLKSKGKFCYEENGKIVNSVSYTHLTLPTSDLV